MRPKGCRNIGMACIHGSVRLRFGVTSVHLIAWIKHFDAQTAKKAGDKWHRVILDNHESHCTLQFLEYARAHKICIVGYPPNCTHALQSLDVVCFGNLRVLWGKKLKEMDGNEESVTKRNFLSIYATVRDGAFTKATILSAFRATGIWPYDPDVIKPHQLAPARESSTESGAPLPLPNDVRDVVEVLRLCKISPEEVECHNVNGASCSSCKCHRWNSNRISCQSRLANFHLSNTDTRTSDHSSPASFDPRAKRKLHTNPD